MKINIFAILLLIFLSCDNKPKIIMNEIEGKNGNKYLLQPDKKTIIALNKKGQKIWSANVIDFCGTSTIGKIEIRSIKKLKNSLNIVYGKHSFANIDVSNGKIICLGED